MPLAENDVRGYSRGLCLLNCFVLLCCVGCNGGNNMYGPFDIDDWFVLGRVKFEGSKRKVEWLTLNFKRLTSQWLSRIGIDNK